MRRNLIAYGVCAGFCTLVAGTSARSATQEFVDRPDLKPGAVVLWHSNLDDSAETFLGYIDDPDCPQAPCSRWLGSSWRGPTYFLEDADLNIYKGTTTDGQPVAIPYAKRLTFPVAIGKQWETRFRNAAGWEIQQSVTVVGWENVRFRSETRNALHLHAVNHRLNGSPYLGSAAWFAEDYFVSPVHEPAN
jgi:hypothetical protein